MQQERVVLGIKNKLTEWSILQTDFCFTNIANSILSNLIIVYIYED